MECYFCKKVMTRQELLTSHACQNVVPARKLAIKAYNVVNARIIENNSEYKKLTTCRICKDFMRKPLQCASCSSSYCQPCLTRKDVENRGIQCINKDCKAPSGNLQPVSRMVKNILEQLKIKCPECSQIVSYANYEEHQLSHTFCAFCYKEIPTWKKIKQHLYLECPKYKINCVNCEFIFKRENYLTHDCLKHYNLRRIELFLFAVSALLQGVVLGLTKQLKPEECQLFEGIRYFAKTVLPNILLSFWGVCMWINYRSVQSDAYFDWISGGKKKRSNLQLN